VTKDDEIRVLCSDEWTLRHCSSLRRTYIELARKRAAELEQERKCLLARAEALEAIDEARAA